MADAESDPLRSSVDPLISKALSRGPDEGVRDQRTDRRRHV